MKLIVGLGNPGAKYAGTRHNIGFAVINKLTDRYGIHADREKFKGLIGEGRICGEKVILLKPLTFMNLSGESVRAVCDFYKLTNEDLIVIYDDISLPEGGIRIRQKGSAGGHNGIKNIIAHMGTDVFDRIKVGVGQKPEGWELVNHVLGCFSDVDVPIMEEALDRAADAVAEIIKFGAEKAMNKCNFIPKKEV